jgi:hypothetical protein
LPRLVQKNKYVYLHTIREGNAFRVANQRGRIFSSPQYQRGRIFLPQSKKRERIFIPTQSEWDTFSLAQSERENPYPCYIRYRYYPIREEVYSHLPNERGKIFPSLQPERCVNKEY